MRLSRKLTGVWGFALAFAVHEALFAVLSGRMEAPALTLAGALGALVVALALGWKRLDGLFEASRGLLALEALGGLLAWLAIYLVAANRYSDAPSGTEMVFFTAPVWACLAVAAAAVPMLRRRRYWQAGALIAGALAAAVGCMGVLGNWERPSSFSPLVRFPAQETWFVVAGAAFVACGWVLSRSKRPAAAGVVAALTASTVAFVTWIATGGGSGQIEATMGGGEVLVFWALAFGLTLAMWPRALASGRPALSGAAMALVPVAMSVLTYVESLVGAFGPRPLLPGPVGAASVLVVAGLARVASSEGDSEAASWSRWRVVAAAAAAVALVAALGGLLMPALDATLTSQIGDTVQRIRWTLFGAETVSGLAAVALALLAIAAVRDRGPWPALLALASAVAYPVLLTTPTHVLTTWLPGDLQSDLGSEYVRIDFAHRLDWPSIGATIGACVALLLTSAAGGLRARRHAAPEPDTEVGSP